MNIPSTSKKSAVCSLQSPVHSPRSSVFRLRSSVFPRAGFTLLEMLVVIAIIMLLAGLILAAVNVARDRAKDLRARRDVAQLKTAFTAYYGDYNRFPDLQDSSTTNVPGVSGDVVICDNDVIRILRGREDPTGENPKKISYMDFHQNTSAFNDPWGNPYRITLDTDYDSNVEIPSGEVRQSVAAWSAGKDEKDGTDDDPRTWR